MLVADLLAVAKILWKYGPLVAAVAQYIEQQEGLAAQRAAATDFERGFRVLTETKNPTLLQNAILARCGPDGCLLP